MKRKSTLDNKIQKKSSKKFKTILNRDMVDKIMAHCGSVSTLEKKVNWYYKLADRYYAQCLVNCFNCDRNFQVYFNSFKEKVLCCKKCHMISCKDCFLVCKICKTHICPECTFDEIWDKNPAFEKHDENCVSPCDTCKDFVKIELNKFKEKHKNCK